MTKNTCVSVGPLEVHRPGLDTHLEVHRVGLYTGASLMMLVGLQTKMESPGLSDWVWLRKLR